MDSRLSGKSNVKFSDRLRDSLDPQPGHRFHGSVCHCKNALEICETDDDLFPDRNDGADPE